MNERSARDHRAELIAMADAFLHDLNERSHAARERVYAGVAPPFCVAAAPAVDFGDAQLPVRLSADPVFATREFDVPDELAGLLKQYDSILGD